MTNINSDYLFDCAFHTGDGELLSDSDRAAVASLFTGVDVVVPYDIDDVNRLTLHSEGSKDSAIAESYKPKNLLLNWRKAIESAPENALMTAGSVASNWLMVLAALAIARQLYSLMKITLSVEHAGVIDLLWKEVGPQRGIPEEEAFLIVSKRSEECFEKGLVLRTDFYRIIDDLVALRCLDLSDGEIRIIETVHYNQ